jgi:hypothetical protein
VAIYSILVFLILLTVGGVVFFLYQRAHSIRHVRYEEKPLFEKGDAILFGRLCRALPDCYVFPRLTLAAIMEPTEGNRKRNPERFKLLDYLTVNFAVFGSDLALVCVVVLENNTHNPEDGTDPLTVRLLKKANIKMVHYNAANKPSVEQIVKTIGPLVAEQAKHRLESGMTINPNTVQRIYADDPVPAPPPPVKGLTQDQLNKLTPDKVLCKVYPHIWQRVCLFAPEPQHLQKYLISLSIQDRGEKRAGFPIEALKEIADIQTENDRFLTQPVVGWQPAFVNR